MGTDPNKSTGVSLIAWVVKLNGCRASWLIKKERLTPIDPSADPIVFYYKCRRAVRGWVLGGLDPYPFKQIHKSALSVVHSLYQKGHFPKKKKA